MSHYLKIFYLFIAILCAKMYRVNKALRRKNQPVQCLSKFGHSKQFSYFIWSQIVETLKWKTFLFDFLDDVQRNFLELSQRTH